MPCYISWNIYKLKCFQPFREPSPTTTKSDNPKIQAVQFNSQAVAAFKLQDFHKAIELFTEAICLCLFYIGFASLSRVYQTALDAEVASYHTNRGVAYSRTRNYMPALADFNAATTANNGIATIKILVQIARCRLFLGSPSSALLAVQDALCLDPTDSNVHALKKRVVELQGHMNGYKDAMVHKCWRMARSSYESCLRAYAQEDGDPPIDVQCWRIEILIAERDWDTAVTATGCVL
jgi:tetratricopeptide (TPR) repeat protein